MFKRTISIIAALAIGVTMAACGGQAKAADLTFKATDGQVFGTKNVYLYEMNAAGGGYVRVTNLNGSQSLFVDGGSLAGRILQNMPQLVNVTGTNSYVDPTYAARVVCSNGASIVSLPNSGIQVSANDACLMFQQIQSKAK